MPYMFVYSYSSLVHQILMLLHASCSQTENYLAFSHIVNTLKPGNTFASLFGGLASYISTCIRILCLICSAKER